MLFLWVRAEDEAGANSIRDCIERNSIAMLSNYDRESVDPLSRDWLGLSCPNLFVKKSGLWKMKHVKDDYDSDFFNTLEMLVKKI